MKIAHVVCVYPPYKGGMGNSVYNFVKYLTNNGYQIKVFTADYNEKDDLLSKNNDNIERIKPFFKIGNAAFLPQLLWKLNGFDIVHLHYPFFGAAEYILIKKIFVRKKFKLITHFHMDNQARGAKGFIFFIYKAIVLPLLAKASDIIISSSLDYVKHSSLRKYFLKNSDKFREVRFGVDLNKFAVKNESLDKSSKKNILFVGRLDKAYHSKGLDVLLRAMEIIMKKTESGAVLKVVGEGNLRKNYIELAEKLKVSDNVEFLEKIDNKTLVDYYNSCDVFVLPSSNKGEAFGIVLLEAMACAKPVVASNIPGVRSVFIKGKHGLLFKAGDADDLAEKISLILNDENMAKKMGQEARKYAEKYYSLEISGAKLGLIYNQLIKK